MLLVVLECSEIPLSNKETFNRIVSGVPSIILSDHHCSSLPVTPLKLQNFSVQQTRLSDVTHVATWTRVFPSLSWNILSKNLILHAIYWTAMHEPHIWQTGVVVSTVLPAMTSNTLSEEWFNLSPKILSLYLLGPLCSKLHI